MLEDLLLLFLATVDGGASSSLSGLRPYQGNENVLVSAVPEVPADLKDALAPYLETRPAELMDATADGQTLLLSTRFGSTSQLHLVERPLGARTQLTFGAEPIGLARFHPLDPQTVFFLRDVGGGEFFQVYRLDRRTGQTERLTDGKSRHERLVVSPDGAQLSYSGTARNGRDSDVYVQPTTGGPARRLFEESGTFYPLEFSPDGKWLLLTQFRSRDDSALFVMELETGKRTELTPPDKRGSLTVAAFDKKGEAVFAVTDRFTDPEAVYRVALAQPSRWEPLAADLKWSVDDLSVSSDGTRLALNVNEDGFSRLYFLELKSRKRTQVTLPAGVMGRMRHARKADRLAFAFQTTRSVQDLWTVDPKSLKPVRYTEGELGGLRPEALFTPSLVRYPSQDGITVPAFLYRPQAMGKAKDPVVVIFHGGPESQMRPSFNPFVQFLVRRGFAVVLPNVRGSDGYGRAYRSADDGTKREQSLADIGATLDFIASQPELDATRVGVYGGSYGGYMTLCAASFYPERVKAAVDVVGISSLATFLKNTQAYRQDLRRAEYGDERVPEVRAVQDRISPLHHVDKIQSALYVLQGKNDPRVPQSEAEQIVQAVRGKGREVWYLLALNEGHGFSKKENRDSTSLSVAAFFEKHLR